MMFDNARIKLTAWYLLIIMAVSIAFSLFIFRVADHEMVRIDRRQQLLRERFKIEMFRRGMLEDYNVPIDIIDLRKRIIFTLSLVNLVIFMIAGGAGYFLAGRTLKPIKDMIDEQSRFISDASHELRTPLTSLRSAMEVHLRDKKLSLAQAKSLIAANIDDVNKLQSLSDALLQLAQYQKPNHSWLVEPLRVDQLVGQAVRRLEILAKKKNINIKNQAENHKMEGNKQGLIDLLVILLDNAVKYSPPNSQIVINSKKTDRSVSVSVKDEGIGIAGKDIPFIFDRFFRSDYSRSKTKATGYGLGLSIAKKITDLHRGTISVDSKPDYGSLFTVRLPVKQSSHKS